MQKTMGWLHDRLYIILYYIVIHYITANLSKVSLLTLVALNNVLNPCLGHKCFTTTLTPVRAVLEALLSIIYHHYYYIIAFRCVPYGYYYNLF